MPSTIFFIEYQSPSYLHILPITYYNYNYKPNQIIKEYRHTQYRKMQKIHLFSYLKPYLICLEHNEQIDCICISQQCPSQSSSSFLSLSLLSSQSQSQSQSSWPFPWSRLCCYQCQNNNHNKHELSNIKIFVSKIEQIDKISQESFLLSAKIDGKVQEIRQFAFKNKEQFQDYGVVLAQFDKWVEQKVMGVMGLVRAEAQLRDSLRNMQITIDKQEKEENKFKNERKRIQKQFIKFYDKYSHYFEQKDNQPQTSSSPYSKTLTQSLTQLSQSLSQLSSLKSQQKLSTQSFLSLFPISSSFQSFNPIFCQHYKGPCMKITLKSAEMQTSSSQRVLALDPCLDSNSRIKKWKIRIKKLVSWIGLGACHINKLKQANWYFYYSNTHHGSYFISSNGYCWSSFKPEFNSKFQSFSFKTGDVVEIEYNPRERKIKYEKIDQGGGKNSTYTIQVDNNGDPLHPAVNLTGVGDSVEIL